MRKYARKDIQKLKGRAIFFDANVLIYLFWSIPNDSKAERYASFFSVLLENKNRLVVNSFVLSEVINRELRIEYNNSDKTLDFKEFRNSPDGIQAQKDIFEIVKGRILNTFSVIDEKLSAQDIAAMLTVDKLDFNDKIIADTCRKNNFVLLTHDADFSNSDIEILTANNNL